MLLIPESIEKKELKKMKKYFSLSNIIAMGKKVQQGLGMKLKKEDGYDIVKLKTTFGGVAGRSIFFLVTEKKDVVPVIVRLKKDSLGENLSFQNKEFVKIFEENKNLIFDDLEKERVRVVAI